MQKKKKERKSRPNPYTLHKNLLKMDHKHKLKMQNYCTKVEHRRKYKQSCIWQ